MPKYLKTKEGSLESAVLEAVSPAQQAAIAISKKEKGEKPKNEEKVECPKCKGEGCDHCDGKGYHTTEELTAKQKKIDMNKDGKITGDDLAKLRAKGAKKEEVKEELSLAELAAKHIADMWKEASKSPKKEEEDPKKKESKTTMTGKPMSGVEINPKSKED
jgi:uncharacterized membrane-anchored protein YjiN (DUF445 family)